MMGEGSMGWQGVKWGDFTREKMGNILISLCIADSHIWRLARTGSACVVYTFRVYEYP
jgi:hypothetical protein